MSKSYEPDSILLQRTSRINWNMTYKTIHFLHALHDFTDDVTDRRC